MLVAYSVFVASLLTVSINSSRKLSLKPLFMSNPCASSSAGPVSSGSPCIICASAQPTVIGDHFLSCIRCHCFAHVSCYYAGHSSLAQYYKQSGDSEERKTSQLVEWACEQCLSDESKEYHEARCKNGNALTISPLVAGLCISFAKLNAVAVESMQHSVLDLAKEGTLCKNGCICILVMFK